MCLGSATALTKVPLIKTLPVFVHLRSHDVRRHVPCLDNFCLPFYFPVRMRAIACVCVAFPNAVEILEVPIINPLLLSPSSGGRAPNHPPTSTPGGKARCLVGWGGPKVQKLNMLIGAVHKKQQGPLQLREHRLIRVQQAGAVLATPQLKPPSSHHQLAKWNSQPHQTAPAIPGNSQYRRYCRIQPTYQTPDLNQPGGWWCYTAGCFTLHALAIQGGNMSIRWHARAMVVYKACVCRTPGHSKGCRDSTITAFTLFSWL